MRISDCSSDVCSSDSELEAGGDDLLLDDRGIDPVQRIGVAQPRSGLGGVIDHDIDAAGLERGEHALVERRQRVGAAVIGDVVIVLDGPEQVGIGRRSEEHTSELQSLMRISYAVFCLTKKNNTKY